MKRRFSLFITYCFLKSNTWFSSWFCTSCRHVVSNLLAYILMTNDDRLSLQKGQFKKFIFHLGHRPNYNKVLFNLNTFSCYVFNLKINKKKIEYWWKKTFGKWVFLWITLLISWTNVIWIICKYFVREIHPRATGGSRVAHKCHLNLIDTADNSLNVIRYNLNQPDHNINFTAHAETLKWWYPVRDLRLVWRWRFKLWSSRLWRRVLMG